MALCSYTRNLFLRYVFAGNGENLQRSHDSLQRTASAVSRHCDFVWTLQSSAILTVYSLCAGWSRLNKKRGRSVIWWFDCKTVTEALPASLISYSPPIIMQ